VDGGPIVESLGRVTVARSRSLPGEELRRLLGLLAAEASHLRQLLRSDAIALGGAV